jgi:hypothetical protein
LLGSTDCYSFYRCEDNGAVSYYEIPDCAYHNKYKKSSLDKPTEKELSDQKVIDDCLRNVKYAKEEIGSVSKSGNVWLDPYHKKQSECNTNTP